MKTCDLTGQDLVYWVARANMAGSPQKSSVMRSHYGHGQVSHDSINEPAMRAFVAGKLGNELPARETWH